MTKLNIASRSLSMPDYTIVIPVYYNEGSLFPTMDAIYNEVIKQNGEYSCEVIFVDDGSGDNSLEELLSIRKQYPDIVKIIKLTRNFGQGNALLAGFSYAKGKCVVAISADGQDPPDLINDMLRAFFKENYEVVACTREARDESFYRVITSKIFYSLMRRMAFPNMPAGGFDYYLLGRRALSVFFRNIDKHPFFQGAILWTGFKTKYISYVRRKRTIGKSRFTLGKKITVFLDGLMSYSFTPIRLMSVIGIAIAFVGFLGALYLVLARIFGGTSVIGWTSIIVAVLVLGGLQMIMLGIIGEYLWRTLSQVRNRDFYIIDVIYDEERETWPERERVNFDSETH